jgi:hypothetical protein
MENKSALNPGNKGNFADFTDAGDFFIYIGSGRDSEVFEYQNPLTSTIT